MFSSILNYPLFKKNLLMIKLNVAHGRWASSLLPGCIGL